MSDTTNPGYAIVNARREIAPDASDLVLCESADGWSLHAPGSTDEEIASGDAPYLVCGEGEPTAEDYAQALAILMERAAQSTTARSE